MAAQEIIDAIRTVRKNVKSIKHDAENPHGEYTYVSIDTYYEKVASVATEAGLIWRTRELEFVLLDGQGRSKDRTYVKSRYAYDLYAGASEFENYMTVSIIGPIDGPQTTGQQYSYADKVFMRVAFCVATGEKDADATKQENINVSVPKPNGADFLSETVGDLLERAPPPHDPETGEIPTDVPLASKFKDGLPILDTRKIDGEKAAALVEGIFKTFVPGVKTPAKLRDFHAENLAAIEKVKTIDPAAHDRIKVLFNEHNLSLKKGTK